MDPTTREGTRLNRAATRLPVESDELARAMRVPERRRWHGRIGPATTPRPPWLGRGAAQGLIAFVLYLGVAMGYIGRYAMRSPGSGTIGTGPDVQIFLWGLRWWAYALEHGLDPLHSSLIWSPYGTDVLWTTTVPLVSVLAAPLTLTLGVTVTWNILSVLAPALSAWAAYLLCRELTGNRWGAFIGGALFGFSSFELAQSVAHLQLTMNLLVPLAAWVLVRHLRGKLGSRGLALRVGAIAVCQFLISPEVLSTMLVGGALAGPAAFALLPEQRAALRRATVWSAAGLAGAGVMLAPLLFTMLRDAPGRVLNSATAYSGDLLNLIVPTRVTALGGTLAAAISSHFPGNIAEQGAYLGLPMVAIVGWFAVSRRSDRTARLLLALLITAIVLSLGPRLQIGGHQTIWLPGALLQHVPFLDDALPTRFSMYTALIAAVIASRWLADRPARWQPRVRWLLAALALVALAPTESNPLWWKDTPRAISSGTLARALPAGSTAISLPFWDPKDRSLYAQATSGMRFRLIDEWVQDMPRRYQRLVASINHLTVPSGAKSSRSRAAQLERELTATGIDYVIVWDSNNAATRLLAALRLKPERANGVLVYRLTVGAPSRSKHRAQAPLSKL
jgi:hypothetical protein